VADNLRTIRDIISEHHSIKRHVKLVGDSVSDLDALFRLQQVHAGWAQSSIEALSKKQEQLLQAIGFLDEGLRNHFAFEEKALPPLLGETIMKALLLEHQDISRRLGEVKARVTGVAPEALSQEELLSRKTHLQQTISNLCQMVEEHAADEEVILKMVKRSLEDEGTGGKAA
jgi:hemerythrin